MVSLSLRKERKDSSASSHVSGPQRSAELSTHSSHPIGPNDTNSDHPKRQTSISSSIKHLFVKSPKLHPSSDVVIPPTALQKSPEQNSAKIDETIDPEAELLASTGLLPLSIQEDCPLRSTISRSSSRTGRKSANTSRAASRDRNPRRDTSGSVDAAKRDHIASVVEGSLRIFEDGSHEHELKPVKVLEKVPTGSGILSGFLRKSSTANGDAAFSVLPEQNRMDFQKRLSIQSRKTFDENDEDNFDESDGSSSSSDDEDVEDETDRIGILMDTSACIGDPQLNLINKLTEQINNNEDPSVTTTRSYKLSDKYGKCVGLIGKGSYGIVKLVSKQDMATKKEIFYAVKELKRKDGEDVSHFSTRLTSEFVISNSLSHLNIVKTIDLMRNPQGIYSEIMEYCSGGDLYSYISKNGRDGLNYIEADCYMKQIMNGLAYMHSRGVAHCDIKPENILLTVNGVAKLSDFGTSAVFKTAWENEIHFSCGACGSEPYVAPEEFLQDEYDPRDADIWAVGVLYLTMMTGTYAWLVAKTSDDLFEAYLHARPSQGKIGTFEPIEVLKFGEFYKSRKQTLYGMLDPNPKTRFLSSIVLKSTWMENTKLCEAAKDWDLHW